MFTRFRHRSFSWTKWITHWSYRRISFEIHFNIVICYTPGREHTLTCRCSELSRRFPSSIYCMCTRLCGGSRVIWFVFAFRCHIQRTILRRCLQASYYANWIFIIQIPGWYLKFLSSLEKQICFHLILETQSTCRHFFLLFILPCFTKPIIKKVLANLKYSKCRLLKHFLN